jgi:hypothetical protein
MRKIRFLFVMLTSLTVLLSACGSQQENHEDMTVPVETSEVVYEPGAWMDMTLTDARTQAEFKLSDYKGQVVILEMMDPGCNFCLTQIKEVAKALETLDDTVVTISVDVGYKGEAALVSWADRNGATWTVTLMPKEFSNAIWAEYGGQATYPSNTPIIIIDRAGVPHLTEPGIKSAETLVELVSEWTQ